MLKVSGVARSDVGRVRQQNQDCFVVDERLGLFAVADGMGGHAGGEIASKTAIEAVIEVIRDRHEVIARVASGDEHRDTLAEVVDEAVAAAATRVYDLATSPKGQSGMGCTLTVLLITGRLAAMGHVGDSRLYLVRGDEVSQLSRDHTVVGEMVRGGMVDEEAVLKSPFSHVLTRAVGTQPRVQVDTLVLETVSGDRFVLCSDGFSNHLDEPDEIRHVVSAGLDREKLQEAVDDLVAVANAEGGEDNITVLLVSVESESHDLERAQAVRERYGALRSVFMFEDLDRSMISRVMSVCRVERHAAGDVVIELGELSGELFVVVSGRYELADEQGVLGHLGPSEFAGATTLLKPRPSRARLRATEPSRLLRLSGTEFSRLIRRRPWLGIGLLERIGRRLSEDLDRSYEQREGKGDTVRIRERF